MTSFLKTVLSYHERKRKLLYIMLIGFLLAFAGAHAYSIFIVTSYVFFHGFHIHHFYFGAIILWLGGIIALLGTGKKSEYVASGFIGVGMGLFVDEVGLLLNCTTPEHVCTYAFSANGDLLVSLTLLVLVLVLMTGISDYRQERRAKQDDEN